MEARLCAGLAASSPGVPQRHHPGPPLRVCHDDITLDHTPFTGVSRRHPRTTPFFCTQVTQTSVGCRVEFELANGEQTGNPIMRNLFTNNSTTDKFLPSTGGPARPPATDESQTSVCSKTKSKRGPPKGRRSGAQRASSVASPNKFKTKHQLNKEKWKEERKADRCNSSKQTTKQRYRSSKPGSDRRSFGKHRKFDKHVKGKTARRKKPKEEPRDPTRGAPGEGPGNAIENTYHPCQREGCYAPKETHFHIVYSGNGVAVGVKYCDGREKACGKNHSHNYHTNRDVEEKKEEKQPFLYAAFAIDSEEEGGQEEDKARSDSRPPATQSDKPKNTKERYRPSRPGNVRRNFGKHRKHKEHEGKYSDKEGPGEKDVEATPLELHDVDVFTRAPSVRSWTVWLVDAALVLTIFGWFYYQLQVEIRESRESMAFAWHSLVHAVTFHTIPSALHTSYEWDLDVVCEWSTGDFYLFDLTYPKIQTCKLVLEEVMNTNYFVYFQYIASTLIRLNFVFPTMCLLLGTTLVRAWWDKRVRRIRVLPGDQDNFGSRLEGTGGRLKAAAFYGAGFTTIARMQVSARLARAIRSHKEYSNVQTCDALGNYRDAATQRMQNIANSLGASLKIPGQIVRNTASYLVNTKFFEARLAILNSPAAETPTVLNEAGAGLASNKSGPVRRSLVRMLVNWRGFTLFLTFLQMILITLTCIMVASVFWQATSTSVTVYSNSPQLSTPSLTEVTARCLGLAQHTMALCTRTLTPTLFKLFSNAYWVLFRLLASIKDVR